MSQIVILNKKSIFPIYYAKMNNLFLIKQLQFFSLFGFSQCKFDWTMKQLHFISILQILFAQLTKDFKQVSANNCFEQVTYIC